MRARTSTDVYRALAAPLRRPRLPFLALAAAGVRAGCKRKLPLLLLYGPVSIATVVFSFVVYGKYAALARIDAAPLEGLQGGLVALLAQRAAQNLEVRMMVLQFDQSMGVFALLAAAWFASGLVSDDVRLGAHRLYFARPLTRLDYFLGKLATATTFGGLAMLAPGLVICLVAAASSPDWSFLRTEGDVVLATAAYAGLWVLYTSLLALAASSLVRRKILALAGVFGFFFVLHAAAGVLEAQGDATLFVISPLLALLRIAEQIFGYAQEQSAFSFGPGVAWSAVLGVMAAALAIVACRLRRVEVVA